MKIILSRKGFDSAWGGCPSPVLPDGTMLSMPIPADENTGTKYDEIRYGTSTYLDIWKQLVPRQRQFPEYCHLDPDLRPEACAVPANWRAAFGQVDASQTHLENQGVGVGDLFLFFGWFRETDYAPNGRLRYKPNVVGKHMLFGYLQIGEILRREDVCALPWHPHADQGTYGNTNNAIYVAADKLSGTDLPGHGTFRYNDALVLTKNGYARSRWALPDFFKEVRISHHNADSFRDGYFQSVPIGQEFVVSEDERVTRWAYEIIRNGISCRKEKMPMNVQILSESAAKQILRDNAFPAHTAVICFTDAEPTIDYSSVTDRVFCVDVPDVGMDDLTDCKYTLDDFADAMRADDLAQFILDAHRDGYDFICQCTWGESRSAAAAAAIREFFMHDGIRVFADYRYCPNQLVFNTLYDALKQ